MIKFAFPLLLMSASRVSAACSNKCSGHGVCNHFGDCECYAGFQDADCSQKTCPFGNAWSDQAVDIDSAHQQAECSNRGICDRESGYCDCMEGFTGSSCQRMTCPSECGGHGSCISMLKLGSETRNSESVSYKYNSVWDADKLFGCHCDEGYSGYDCSQMTCQTGDDPLTKNQANEIQLLRCTSDSTGSFVLYFNGRPSPTIQADASRLEFEALLEHTDSIGDLEVSFSDSAANVCSSTSRQIVMIEFKQSFGNLPPLVANTDYLSEGSSISVSADGRNRLMDSLSRQHISVKGSKENKICSGRGICDSTSGICDCFNTNGDIYGSSNGYGMPGSRGDCGYPLTSIHHCPGDGVCSGHGNCQTPNGLYFCECLKGWSGGDCSLRSCPKGLSWFDYPSSNNVAHNTLVECSNGGICDTTSGLCQCDALYFGSACEYMVCDPSRSCNHNGECLSMRKLAKIANANGDATEFTYGSDKNNPHTWDADRIFGCSCDDDYTGFDCSLKTCPSGDDPATYNDVTETQLMQCFGTDGVFTLSFRQQVTEFISFDASADDVEHLLEDLDNIDDVTISFSLGTSACTSDGSNIVTISFDAVHGNLPALIPAVAMLENEDNPPYGLGEIAVAQDGESLGGEVSVSGTTEDLECSNHGLCNRNTGHCECFTGWSSSDGKGAKGTKQDCGYRVLAKGNWLIV